MSSFFITFRSPRPGEAKPAIRNQIDTVSSLMHAVVAMYVSGLTVLKNVVQLSYQYEEAIRSALPLCDEFIAVVGKSDDDTLERVKAIDDPKIRIVETEWSTKVYPQDCVLAQQTNIGLLMCRGDWVVYVQANEIIHEKSYPVLKNLMEKHVDNDQVEALLLERLTFWGDYDHVVPMYPHRFKYLPRIMKPHIGTYALRGAMNIGVFDGFGLHGRYPRAIDTGEDLYRYGLVSTPEDVLRKDREATHMVDYANKNVQDDFFYTCIPKSHVCEYNGDHPAVMQKRITEFNQKISMDDPRWRSSMTLKERQRVWETRFYESVGLLKARNVRYKLLGKYAQKSREY